MSEKITVNCPKCSVQMQLERPQGPVDVTCPKCNQQLRLGGDAASTSQPKAPKDPFANVPAPVTLATEPPALVLPRKKEPKRKIQGTPVTPSRYRTMPTPRARKKRRPVKWKVPLILLSVVGFFGLLATGVYLSWDKLPIETLTANVLWAEMPEKVCADYVDVITDFGALLQDPKSGDAIVPKIDALTQRAR